MGYNNPYFQGVILSLEPTSKTSREKSYQIAISANVEATPVPHAKMGM